MRRDKAHGDTNPSIIVADGGEIVAYMGQEKTQSEDAVTAQHSTFLRLVGRRGRRFSRLDPILMEPVGLKCLRRDQRTGAESGHTK